MNMTVKGRILCDSSLRNNTEELEKIKGLMSGLIRTARLCHSELTSELIIVGEAKSTADGATMLEAHIEGAEQILFTVIPIKNSEKVLVNIEHDKKSLTGTFCTLPNDVVARRIQKIINTILE